MMENNNGEMENNNEENMKETGVPAENLENENVSNENENVPDENENDETKKIDQQIKDDIDLLKKYFKSIEDQKQLVNYALGKTDKLPELVEEVNDEDEKKKVANLLEEVRQGFEKQKGLLYSSLGFGAGGVAGVGLGGVGLGTGAAALAIFTSPFFLAGSGAFLLVAVILLTTRAVKSKIRSNSKHLSALKEFVEECQENIKPGKIFANAREAAELSQEEINPFQKERDDFNVHSPNLEKFKKDFILDEPIETNKKSKENGDFSFSTKGVIYEIHRFVQGAKNGGTEKNNAIDRLEKFWTSYEKVANDPKMTNDLLEVVMFFALRSDQIDRFEELENDELADLKELFENTKTKYGSASIDNGLNTLKALYDEINYDENKRLPIDNLRQIENEKPEAEPPKVEEKEEEEPKEEKEEKEIKDENENENKEEEEPPEVKDEKEEIGEDEQKEAMKEMVSESVKNAIAEYERKLSKLSKTEEQTEEELKDEDKEIKNENENKEEEKPQEDEEEKPKEEKEEKEIKDENENEKPEAEPSKDEEKAEEEPKEEKEEKEIKDENENENKEEEKPPKVEDKKEELKEEEPKEEKVDEEKKATDESKDKEKSGKPKEEKPPEDEKKTEEKPEEKDKGEEKENEKSKPNAIAMEKSREARELLRAERKKQEEKNKTEKTSLTDSQKQKLKNLLDCISRLKVTDIVTSMVDFGRCVKEIGPEYEAAGIIDKEQVDNLAGAKNFFLVFAGKTKILENDKHSQEAISLVKTAIEEAKKGSEYGPKDNKYTLKTDLSKALNTLKYLYGIYPEFEDYKFPIDKVMTIKTEIEKEQPKVEEKEEDTKIETEEEPNVENKDDKKSEGHKEKEKNEKKYEEDKEEKELEDEKEIKEEQKKQEEKPSKQPTTATQQKPQEVNTQANTNPNTPPELENSDLEKELQGLEAKLEAKFKILEDETIRKEWDEIISDRKFLKKEDDAWTQEEIGKIQEAIKATPEEKLNALIEFFDFNNQFAEKKIKSLNDEQKTMFTASKLLWTKVKEIKTEIEKEQPNKEEDKPKIEIKNNEQEKTEDKAKEEEIKNNKEENPKIETEEKPEEENKNDKELEEHKKQMKKGNVFRKKIKAKTEKTQAQTAEKSKFNALKSKLGEKLDDLITNQQENEYKGPLGIKNKAKFEAQKKDQKGKNHNDKEIDG